MKHKNQSNCFAKKLINTLRCNFDDIFNLKLTGLTNAGSMISNRLSYIMRISGVRAGILPQVKQ